MQQTQAWVAGLGTDDLRMVAEVARNAAIFHTLCILDGVVVIDDPPHAELVLTAVSASGEPSVIVSSQSVVDLHDQFNAVVHPPSEPWPPVA